MSRITGPEFAAHRSRLGLTMAELGKRLGVRADTIKRWESEREPVPYRVPEELAELHRQQDALVRRMVDADVVRDGDEREAFAFAQLGQQGEHLRAHRDVQG